MWDVYRGRHLPLSSQVEATDSLGLDLLADSLLEARWRFASRQSYNRWFRCWEAFANRVDCEVFPAQEQDLQRFFVYLSLHYAAATVQISAHAIVAIHRLNCCDNPLSDKLKSLLKAIAAVGACGSRCKKFIVDGSFVVAMCSKFLEEYPVYDNSIFDPSLKPTVDEDRSIMWLRAVAIILLGLEVGARASELCRLTACCWIPRSDGSVYISIKLAKNSKNGEETGAVLVRGEGDFSKSFSAVAFFEEFYIPFMADQGWGVSEDCISGKFRTALCPACSPLFPVCNRAKDKDVHPINRSGITSAVKKWATKIGRDAANYSAISFRRGSISIAAAEKVSRDIRKKHMRWKSEEMQDVYTEVSSSNSKVFGAAIRKAVQKSRRAKGKSVRFSEFKT